LLKLRSPLLLSPQSESALAVSRSLLRTWHTLEVFSDKGMMHVRQA
jgi:hypothetical protein